MTNHFSSSAPSGVQFVFRHESMKKLAFILALPWLNFGEVYGPFALSVSMMFWAFLSGLLLLAGANLSAEEHGRRRI